MVETKEVAPFWQSKTKVGALLIGVGAILATVGGVVQGTIDIGAGITALITEIGVIMTIVGLRNAL